MEVPVVVETGDRVGLRLALEPRADMGVVERQGRRVAESFRELELLGREGRLLADPVDVERPLEDTTGDQRHDDQRLRLVRSPRYESHPWIEMSLVRQHRLAVVHGPAGDPDPERESLAQDLVGVFTAHERGNELAPRLVGLVDVQCLVRHDLGERVGDPDEERVEALVGEQVVENVRELPVGVDEGSSVRRVACGSDQPHPGGLGEWVEKSRIVHVGPVVVTVPRCLLSSGISGLWPSLFRGSA